MRAEVSSRRQELESANSPPVGWGRATRSPGCCGSDKARVARGLHCRARGRGEFMGISWNKLTLFFISVLGHHRDSLERKMYTKNHQELAGLLRIRMGNKWQ